MAIRRISSRSTRRVTIQSRVSNRYATSRASCNGDSLPSNLVAWAEAKNSKLKKPIANHCITARSLVRSNELADNAPMVLMANCDVEEWITSRVSVNRTIKNNLSKIESQIAFFQSEVSNDNRSWCVTLYYCTVSHIMVMSPQVSWLFFKARMKRPYLDPYGPSEQRGKTANWPRPGGLR